MRHIRVFINVLILAAAVASGDVAVAQTEEMNDESATDGDVALDEAAVDQDEIDWSALNVDALTLMENPAARQAQSKRTSANEPGSAWSSHDNPNGSAAVTVKQAVSPFWDTKIGADLSVVRNGDVAFTQTRPDQYQTWDRAERSTGVAWASMTAPGVGALWDQTAIEARVDPFEDRSKLGTRFSKSLPLANDQYTLTLQNGFNLQQHGVIHGLPVGRAPRTLEIDRTARLRINETGLSLIAGQTFSHADDRWHGKIGAEQNLFGGINVTGSVSQTPDGVLNKSLSAGFKRSW